MEIAQTSFDFEAAERAKNWNAEEGERRKRRGMDQAAANKNPLLTKAREFAVQIAERQGEVTMDDVVMAMECEGYAPGCLGNGAGHTFTGKFDWTGRLIKSKRTNANGNLLRVWKLKDA